MSDRDAILARLRQLQTDTPHPATPSPRMEIGEDLVTELVQRMTTATVNVVKLKDASAVPGWLAGYLKDHQLEPRLVTGTDKALADMPWQQASLECQRRAATLADPLALSFASCGIAESGTVVLESGPDNPASLNFVPDHHVVVLNSDDIVSDWEQAWAKSRQQWPGQQPRALNFISGPSSTADVGLTQVFGAHGPRNLSVLILDSDAAAQ